MSSMPPDEPLDIFEVAHRFARDAADPPRPVIDTERLLEGVRARARLIGLLKPAERAGARGQAVGVIVGSPARNPRRRRLGEGRTQTPPPTADLLIAAQQGDQEAWDALVERFGRLVWAVARSFGVSASDAADLSQTAWLRLVENLDRIKEPERLGSWLATTTRREGMRMLRKRATEIPDGYQEEQTDRSEDGPEDMALAADEHTQLRAALAQMPVRCRELLRVLAASDEASYSEVAAALDMPVGSIGPTRSRCLARLRKEFTRQS